VNHLEPARLDAEVARAVLANVDPAVVEPMPVEDGGFVAYEWIGEKNYLNEPGTRTRGAQVTSVDALMCGRRSDGQNIIVAFEWKYLESYGPDSRATSSRGTDRVSGFTDSCSSGRTARSPLTIPPTFSSIPMSN
jgi:hypothetical protein